MPWTYDDYPNSMKNLDRVVREKAIDIANALLEDGYPDDRAIPIGIAQAKKWAEGDNDKHKSDNLHVVPHPQGWAVRRANGKRVSVIMNTQEAAQARALAMAEAEQVDVILHRADGQIKDHISPAHKP